MHHLNRDLFLNATSFCALTFSLAAATKKFVARLQQYMHRYNHTNLILAYEV